jgi:hypothetical protein
MSAWYERLRDQYRPDQVDVLLVAESPPDPGAGQLRFFYASSLSYDNLYRGIAQALYGEQPDFDITDKQAILRRLQADGFWLVDAVDRPVNHLPKSARRAALRAAVPQLVDRCRALAPRRGVVVCHSAVYRVAAPPLRDADITVLHDTPLPFPLPYRRRRAAFIAGLREALA